MKITLEGREYEVKANGYFMKKYFDTFRSNMMNDLLKASAGKDYLTIAQLTYCAIEDMDHKSFEDWLKSFETPCFLGEEYLKVLDYLVRDCEPTFKEEELKSEKKDVKKKKK